MDVLFGRVLLERGMQIDFVMRANDASVPVGKQQWRGRTLWVGPTDAADGFVHRLRKYILAIWHDVRCLRFAQKSAYDAIQVRDKFLIAVLAIAVARRRGLKFFFWLSWPEPESQLARARERTARYPFLSWIRGHVFGLLLYRWILPRSDHIFVQSEQMRQDVAAHGIPVSKMTPVPMGVDLSQIPPVQRPAMSLDTPLVVGYLGVVSGERKLTVLVEMLAELHRRGRSARLLIVGDGEKPQDRRELEVLAERLGLSQHMEITGFLPRAQALQRISTAHVCISPFYPSPVLRSTSPTKLVEYLALKLPVVANDHPEQRRVMRETRAGICVPWGARYFARGVCWLASRPAAELDAMVERGRAWVEANRTYDRIGSLVEATYAAQLGRS